MNPVSNQTSSQGAHVALEPGALAAGRIVLHSAMFYGFVGPLDIPTECFHPDLQSIAQHIRNARNGGARDHGDIGLYLLDTLGVGKELDLASAKLSEIAEGANFTPEQAMGCSNKVRSYHIAKTRQFLLWKLIKANEQGEALDEILKQIAELETAGDTRKSHSLVVSGVNSFPTIVPPETVILGNALVRIGDIINLISTAGAGKSVAVIQAAMAWALGLPYFGIHPARPLRILLFSGEDDGVTLGQCREGFLEHSEAITGKRLTAADLEPLDRMLRTEFSREHVGIRFHTHLDRLLSESPADLTMINPLLSYIGGEIVACASEWLRAGLMPILQKHSCAALIAHHTGKMAKDGWDNTDDTYSAIGGGEMANIPRSIITMRPTAAEGLSVLKVSKRQTTGWKDSNGDFTTSFFIRRTNDPTRPAWLPVDSDEAEELIGDARPTGSNGKSTKKVTTEHVLDALKPGPTQQQTLIERLMKSRKCSDRTASDAIRLAEKDEDILSFAETNSNGGKAIKWLQLPEHSNQQEK